METDPSLFEALVAAFVDDGPERTYYYGPGYRPDGQRCGRPRGSFDPGKSSGSWSPTSGAVSFPFRSPGLRDTLSEQDAFVESLPEGEMRRRLEALLEDDPDGSKLAQLVNRDRDVRPAWRKVPGGPRPHPGVGLPA